VTKTTPAVVTSAALTYKAWPGLFMGSSMAGEPLFAGPQQAMLALGPPRSGKTTAVVVPNLLTAPGALVTTSTKTDVITWSARARGSRGRTWLFDPSGTVERGWLTPLRWSPVAGCERWEVAVGRAHALASAAQPTHGMYSSDHWTERAEALLGPLLHAAALGGRTMGSVLRWVQRRDVQEAVELASGAGGDEVAADAIDGVLETEERERSGIFSTAANILAAYRLPAALETANEPNFDPEAFVRSSDTVYVCAPASEQQQLAPLVVAFLETLRRATYAREQGWPPVAFVLDEVANIAPLPGLPALVSEGGGQGLVTLACLQDLSQARARWGTAAEGFLTLFGAKVVLPGIADLRTLQLVLALAGDHDVAMRSVTRSSSGLNFSTSTTTYAQRQAVWPIDQVSRIRPGTALAMWPGTPPTQICLTPAWAEPWKGVLEQASQTLS
jgi:type IV secretion system protein VirD4